MALIADHPNTQELVTKMRLNDVKIKALKYTGRQKTYFDDSFPGFGIRVGARRKSFVVMYGKA